MSARYSGLIERYRDRLPVAPSTRIVSLCEGNTPLIKLENIARKRGRGCDICRQTGYKGRLGIFEMMEMHGEIRELIVRRAPLADIEAAARGIGMRTLKEDAFEKVLHGYTNPEEIIRKVMTAGWD